MTQEDKQLLLKDLCARIPYGLFCQTEDGKGKLISVECSTGEDLVYVDFGYPEAKEYDLNEGDSIKPYLRPMSSMTYEEMQDAREKFFDGSDHYDIDNIGEIYADTYQPYTSVYTLSFVRLSGYINWLNAHHFDYRGFIPMGLALEATEGMYKND